MTRKDDILARIAASLPEKTTRGALYDWLVPLATDLLKSLGVDSVDDICDALEEAYDKYIVPHDLAGIPNWLEPAFDKWAKRFICRVVHNIASKLDLSDEPDQPDVGPDGPELSAS